MTKKILTVAAAAVLATSLFSGSALAAIYPIGHANNVNLYVNDTLLQPDQPAILKNGRTLVPLRAIFESLGADVQWDGATQTVTGTKGDTRIELQLGSTQASVNGTAVTLDVPAEMINYRTMVPVRFIAESLGAYVGWDGRTSSVFVSDRSLETLAGMQDFITRSTDLQKRFFTAVNASDQVILNLSAGKVNYSLFRSQYDQQSQSMKLYLDQIKALPLPQDTIARKATEDLIGHWSRMYEIVVKRGALINPTGFDENAFLALNAETRALENDYNTQVIQYKDLIVLVDAADFVK